MLKLKTSPLPKRSLEATFNKNRGLQSRAEGLTKDLSKSTTFADLNERILSPTFNYKHQLQLMPAWDQNIREKQLSL